STAVSKLVFHLACVFAARIDRDLAASLFIWRYQAIKMAILDLRWCSINHAMIAGCGAAVELVSRAR
ncbi:MAG: hypothetical protein AB8B51_21705, partial [Sedimentitalea sp.]